MVSSGSRNGVTTGLGRGGAWGIMEDLGSIP